jgi:ABC-type protease/lipase transport system fused ATPase/permease subunit
MVRYFYAWTPLFVVGTIFVLSAPWLGLIALMVVALVALAALAALAWAVVFVPYHMLSRAISRRSHGRSGASRLTPAALSPASRQNA